MDMTEKQSSSSIMKFEDEYEFLSNFATSLICYEGIWYTTVEHAFQAAKTLDIEERKRISKLATPGQAKRAGRKLALRPDWNGIRIDVMTDLLTLKFADPKLRQLLLNTGMRHLEEGNTWHDNFWGNCQCIDCRGETGINHLGTLLMSIRELIKERVL